MKKILLLVMLLGITFSNLSAGTYSGGSGTVGDPYRIATTADLIELSKTTADWVANTYFIQTAHIVFNENEQIVDWDGDGDATWDATDQLGFSPIGNTDDYFEGSYNGNYHTITNIFINRSYNDNIGLFAYIDDITEGVNTVYRLGLVKVSISGTSSVGGLVGKNRGKISECFTTGSITLLGNYGGGLVGVNVAGSSITRCYSSCSVNSTGLDVGGLVGQAAGTITYCYSTGNVAGTSYVGGFAGTFISAVVNNCYSLGNVTRSSGTDTYFGGFCGYSSNNTIEKCYSTGSVNFGTAQGFIGYASGSTLNNNFFDQTTSGQTTGTGATAKTTTNMKLQVTFTGWDFSGDAETDWVMSSNITFGGYPTLRWTGGYSEAPSSNQIATLPNLVWIAENSSRWAGSYTQTADITTWTTPSWDGNKGWKPIGTNEVSLFSGVYNGSNYKISNLFIERNSNNIGLFGYIYGATISNIGVVSCNLTGNNSVGGLVGFNSNSSNISNSYSTGSVSGNDYVGGLVGWNNNSSISNSYSTGSVTTGNNSVGGLVGYNYSNSSISNSYSTGSVSGNDYVGGLVGYNSSSSISNSYSTGSASGSGSVGGFIGSYVSGTLTANYWKTDGGALNDTGNSGDVANITESSDANLKKQVTFSGWNFTSGTGDWNIGAPGFISYPYIQGITYDAPGASPAVNPIPGLEVGGLSITSATYNASTGELVVTGSSFEANVGVDDIDATKFTFTGQGGATYTLTAATNNVEISSATEFTLTITGVDKNGVDNLLNKNGTSSVDATTYNLAAAANWCTNFSGGADLTENGITVSNVTPFIYVDASKADNSGSGRSWANAKKSLQAALDIAISGDQIWVAKGTYKPTSAYDLTNTSRYYHFRMIEGVEIYGGFAGTETLVSQRTDFGEGGANETILSGDLSNNDNFDVDNGGYQGTTGDDNCYHVFYHPNTISPALTNSAILDGFTIRGGNANNDYANNDRKGGGLLNINQAPIIRNCVFRENYAIFGGSAIRLEGSAAIFINCKIIDNKSGQYAAGISLSSTSPATLTNCLIKNNSSISYGGGVYIHSSNPTLTNVTIVNNASTGGRGGGLYVDANSSPIIQNSIFWGNTAYTDGNQIYIDGTATLNYSCYSNGTGDVYGTPSVSNSITTDPLFADADNDDFRIIGKSPCADAGNDAYNSETTDIRGLGYGRKLLKTDHTQPGTIDMGAYEYKEGTDPIGCEDEVWVDGSFTDQTIGWGVTHFANLTTALENVCTPGTVNISNYSHSGDVDMTDRTFIIGEADFNLTGNLSGGLVQVTNTGKLLMNDLAANTTKTFPITDGTYNYTMTTTTADVNNPDISVRISNLNPTRSINSDFWDIEGPANLNATVTLRIDKAAIAPKTLNNNTQLRYRNSGDTRYVPVNGNNFSIEEFDSYYIITITGVNEF